MNNRGWGGKCHLCKRFKDCLNSKYTSGDNSRNEYWLILGSCECDMCSGCDGLCCKVCLTECWHNFTTLCQLLLLASTTLIAISSLKNMKSKESGRKFQKEVCAGYYAVVLFFCSTKTLFALENIKGNLSWFSSFKLNLSSLPFGCSLHESSQGV